MSVTDNKMAPNAGTIRKILSLSVDPVAGAADLITRITQIPHPFLVEGVSCFCSAVTDVVESTAAVVRPGDTIQAVTLAIGTTHTKFAISAAFDAVMPTRSATGSIPAVVHKAIADDIIFSSAFTITATVAAKRWGAVRIQMDGAGAVSTKVVSANQLYVEELAALVACPAPDAGYLDLGTISMRAAVGKTFTARTTHLDDAVTVDLVNYNGAVSMATPVLTAFVEFADAQFVLGDLEPGIYARSCSQAGGLIVLIQSATAATGVVLDGCVDIHYRVWPVDGEVAVL